jgi:multidrug efflux pump subunit AcrA (membrane-fusion protein)
MADTKLTVPQHTIDALKKNDIDYVSGSDGQIFFNNVLLDECFDIQYSYRELKEPVYGYRSTHFDAMLPGTVIITGQFAINYIHDAYLYTILNTNGEIASDSPIIKSAKANKAISGTLSKGFVKKNLLQQYNELRKAYNNQKDSLSNLQSQIAIYNAQLVDLQNKKKAALDTATSQINNLDSQNQARIDSQWSDAAGKQARQDAANANIDKYNDAIQEWKNNAAALSSNNYNDLSFYNSESIQSTYSGYRIERENAMYSDTDQESRVFDLEVAIAQLNDQYKTEIDRIVEPGFFNTDTSDEFRYRTARDQISLTYDATKAQLEAKEEQIKKAKQKATDDLQALKDLELQLSGLKSQLNTPTIGQFISSAEVKGATNYKEIDALSYIRDSRDLRATPIYSTMSKSFTIDFIYNSIFHKSLVNVYLLGYTHELSVGGNPIREIYSFIAQKVVNTKN